jgi:AraC-like DNA-binding protein
MNLIQSDVPPGSQKGQEIVYALLGTKVLENVAGLCKERVFYGQSRPDRVSVRPKFPAVREFYEGQPPAGSRPGHHHYWPEIATVAEGHLDVAIGDYTYRAARGDWFVVKPNIPHGECCDLARSYYRMVWFEMDRPFPNLHATEYRPGNGYESFGIFGLPQLTPYLRACTAQLFGPQWPTEDQARMHLLRLVAWVMELLDHSLNANLSKASQKVLEVKKLIMGDEEDYPSVKQLAHKVSLSANYLSSLFHAQTGTTIRQYIADRRIERAKIYLAEPSSSIKEVAYRLRFQNPYHFSNAFRRATGMRPSAYQLSLRSLGGGPAHADTHHPREPDHEG